MKIIKVSTRRSSYDKKKLHVVKFYFKEDYSFKRRLQEKSTVYYYSLVKFIGESNRLIVKKYLWKVNFFVIVVQVIQKGVLKINTFVWLLKKEERRKKKTRKAEYCSVIKFLRQR